MSKPKSLRRNPIKLGLMAPLTGLVKIYGQEISWAGQIAVEEVNEAGGLLGRPLELVITDDSSLPETAIPAATKLVKKHQCSALIGNLLSNSRIAVAYRVAEPLKIPYLNFSFYEGSISSPYFFHFAALPNQQIDLMIPEMSYRFGPKMFFSGSNYEWPRGSIDAAKRILARVGGEVVGEEYLTIGHSNFSDLLQKVNRSGADVFIPYFAGTDQINLLKQFTEMGLKERMAVVMGHYDEAMVANLSPLVREGFYSSNTYFMSIDSEENRNYLSRLSKRTDVTGIWPNGNGILTNFGEGTYLCVHAFAQAVREANSLSVPALIEALKNVSVIGPQGRVEMDPMLHHARVNSSLARCNSDGSFTIIKNFGPVDPKLPMRYESSIRNMQGEEEKPLAYASPDGRIFHVTRPFEYLVNRSSEKLIGSDFLDITHPGQFAEGRNFLKNLLNDTTATKRIISRIMRRTEDEPRLVQHTVFVTRNILGEPSSIVLQGCELATETDDKEELHALAMANLDPEGRIEYANQSFRELWGVSTGETLTRVTDQAKFKQILQKANHGWSGDLTSYEENGKTQSIETSIEVLFNQKRRLLGFLMLCKPKHQKERQATFQTSDAILALADVAILATDLKGIIVQANLGAGKMFGYQIEELMGLSVHHLLPPRFRSRHRVHLESLSGQPEVDMVMSRRGTLAGYRQDGSEFPVRISLTKVQTSNGEIHLATIKDVTEEKVAEDLLVWQATHDSLTKLPNRALLNDRLTNAIKRSELGGYGLALFFIDIDSFKMINDGFGHDSGDKLLVSIADRLLHAVRPGDTVCRFGGDEFVILCEDMYDPDSISILIDRIFKSIRNPINLNDQDIFVTASIGVVHNWTEENTPEEILRNADATMYLAKEQGRDCWKIFNNEIHETAMNQLKIANGLRQAIETEKVSELELFYQPIVNADGSVIKAVELLMRWFPDGHPVSPSVFIPIAERTGSILPLGRWAFLNACHAQVELSGLIEREAMPLLSINVSALQLYDHSLTNYFKKTLNETEADPSLILLELTESALMGDVGANRKILEAWGKLGMHLAVDDFGTGYSSLSKLITLPIQKLKIDRTFVLPLETDKRSRSIVQAIIMMAHALGLKVIAEGVETKEQLDILSDMGCDNFQGFYFYKPMKYQAYKKLCLDI